MHTDRPIAISAAGSRKATLWPAQCMTWGELVARFATPTRGVETFKEYTSYNKAQQDDLKDVGGYVGGTFSPERRKAAYLKGRDIITLDLDNIPPHQTQAVLDRLDGMGVGYVAYSTRKHWEGGPRLRVLVCSDRTMTPEEYQPAARKLAEIIGIQWCDPTTFEGHRLMYWPSCSADAQYVYRWADKPFLSVDGTLALYADWRDASQWPRVPGDTGPNLQREAARQGDPHSKQGVIGAFCRVYSVEAAMDEYLSGVYEPCEDGRYTFVGGSTTGGAVVYDDGKFLYSHHATDPCGGRLVNAFDLVRLHLYGMLDDDVDDGSRGNTLPSFRAMREHAVCDPAVRALMDKEKFEEVQKVFGPIAKDEDAQKQEYVEFFGRMQGNVLTTKAVRETLDTLGIQLRTNDISGELDLAGYPPIWSHESAAENLPVHLLDLFHVADMKHVSKDLIMGHLSTIADERRFNPVLDMFKAREWDGYDRMPIIFAILDVTDPLDKILIHRWFIQTAALPDNDPRSPFGADGALSLQGMQGIGKASFFRGVIPSPLLPMFKEGAEIDMRNKDTIIQASAAWVCELGELERTMKRDAASLRPFITASQDQYRAPYARTAKKRARRTSFCATVNPEKFLTDEEGNRRFWTVPVKRIDLQKLRSLDDDFKQQLWAQSYAAFCADRQFSFRLTKEERDALNARNVKYVKAVDFELEVLDVCHFDLPPERWRWATAGDVAKEIELKTNRYPALNRLGRALTKIVNNDPRIMTRTKTGRTLYLLPIAPSAVFHPIPAESNVIPLNKPGLL